jgi:flagellar M-ring protein FliF
MSFDENRAQQPAPWFQQSLATAEDSPVLVKYAALLAGLLIVLAFGVRPALRRAGSAPAVKGTGKGGPRELPAGAPVAAQTVLNPPEPMEVDPERIRTQEIFEQVTSHLKQEPTQSSRLLQSWIHSD